jgi:hypothetical protein
MWHSFAMRASLPIASVSDLAENKSVGWDFDRSRARLQYRMRMNRQDAKNAKKKQI